MNANRSAVGPVVAGVVAAFVLAGCATSSSPAATSRASTTPRGGGTLAVTFVEPEKFTDVQLSDTPREVSRGTVLPAFERAMQQVAIKELPPGFRLDLRVTDIDMAGWMRPTRDGRRLRVVRDDLPAQIRFDYSLTGPTGEVVRSGSERLSRLPSQSVASANIDPQTTILLNEMVGNWIRTLARRL